MNKTTSAIVTTACVGMAMGAAAYMMNGNSRAMKARTRRIKKSTGRALRQAGEFIGSVSHMMR